MPSLSTEGLILKQASFGEADRVLTVLTDRFGKISVIARGVRKITSRRAGNIEVLNQVKLHLFKGRGYTLTEAESLDTFGELKANLALTTYAFHIIELIDRLTVLEQKNPLLYSLVLETLNQLRKSPRQILVRAFEVKLLNLLGFWSAKAVPGLNKNLYKIVQSLELDSWQQISEFDIKPHDALELERVLRYYIEKILESSLKSAEVLRKIKQNG